MRSFAPLVPGGLLKAVKSLDKVDYEGMLPTGSGNYAADPNGGVVRSSLISQPDDSAPTGVKVIKEAFVGPTAKDYKLEKPCFQVK